MRNNYRMNDLMKLLKKANDVYREGAPIISDAEFDLLLSNLQKELDSDTFCKFKKTLFEKSGTIKHEYVVGSLNKLKYGEDDFRKWTTKYAVKNIIVSEKVDGASFVGLYENGIFMSGASRGDGKTGTDWSDKLKYILPSQISYKDKLLIRGELVLCEGDYQTLGFKNGRNGVVGVMGVKDDLDLNALSKVTAIVYDILNLDLRASEIFKILSQLNFRIPKIASFQIDSNTEENLKDFLCNCRNTSNYSLDGLVISTSDYKNENVYYPDLKVAYKINSEGYKTRIIDVEWNLTKTGAVKPVLILEPVEIDGTTVQRANGCNAAMMIEKGTGIGAEVLVVKSGEIIPQVIAIIEQSDVINAPKDCPECGSILSYNGTDVYCDNIMNCEYQKTLRLVSFLRDCGIENVTEKSLIKWNITDIDALLSFVPDTSSKSHVKFYESLKTNIFLNKSANELFSNMYFAGAGTKTINKVLAHWGDDIQNATKGMYEDDAMRFPEGIGQKTVDNMEEDWYYNIVQLKKIINDERYCYEEKKLTNEGKKGINSMLSNKSFLFTGTLKVKRSEAESMVKELGGSIASTVNKNLNYLVVGEDQWGSSSKFKKAKELGIAILTEDEFWDMIE